MKVCIYGAGAIGGYLAVELALAGVDVSCIARGPHLKAMRENGLKLRIGGEEKVTRIACAEEPGEFGPQDFVVKALKAPGRWRWPTASARPSARRPRWSRPRTAYPGGISTRASSGPPMSASTRPPCCRTWSAAGRWR